ncbi:hypothetical protein [Pandoraea bronchicola]|uniref:hypothetical protein n=1 Tax=Pandoraea bronchicola TaxID=2508287 RepID=UPI0012404B47|nr:hypothetical protein [Pandoraea bronchicola]
MAIDDVGARLQTYGERVKVRRNEADQIRAAYDQIQALRNAGFTVKAIWEDLRAGGLEMTHSGFKSALRRISLDMRSIPSAVHGDAFERGSVAKRIASNH